MKILVFDDKEVNRQAAIAQLKGHDLTVVGTYDEAQKALTETVDGEKVKTSLEGQFGGLNLREADDEARRKYFNAEKELEKENTHYPDFDVVLTDLMVPAPKLWVLDDEGQGFVGNEMPLGSIVALLAIAQGVKMVAIVSDTNHHKHPASAALDCFYGKKSRGDAQVVCTNNTMVCVNKKTMEKTTHKDDDRVLVKDWSRVFKQLCGEEFE